MNAPCWEIREGYSLMGQFARDLAMMTVILCQSSPFLCMHHFILPVSNCVLAMVLMTSCRLPGVVRMVHGTAKCQRILQRVVVCDLVGYCFWYLLPGTWQLMGGLGTLRSDQS